MPIYQYVNDATNEVRDIIQKMDDEHVFRDEDGKEWRRLFGLPQASFDTKLDAFSSKDFVSKNRNKRGTLGDLWEQSEHCSEIRKSVEGKDFVKQKVIDDYKRKTKKLHPSEVPSVIEI